MDQNRRETLPVVGNLDRLQLRHCRLAGGIAKAIDPPSEAREALIGFGLKEALANVIIVSRAKEVGSRAPRMRVGATLALQMCRHPGPFFVPGLVVAHAIVQAQANPMDLAHLRPAPGSASKRQQQGDGPSVIARKVHQRQFGAL